MSFLECSFKTSYDTYALHCAKGEYTHMRHGEIRNTFANLMSEVCFDVEIEPKLQSLQGESFGNNSTATDEDARLDVKAKGLLGSRFSRTFFDVKIFNPHAKTSRRLLKDAYKYHESLKNSKYQQSSTSRTEQLLPAHFWLHRFYRTSSYSVKAAHS